MEPRTALVVEDDQDIASLLAMVLGQTGFEVTVAHDGVAALEAFARLDPELITLDLTLPGVDGLELCRRFRRTSSAYLLMLTARHQEVDRLVGLEVGADDYMTKPFSVRELKARVAALYRRPMAFGDAAPAVAGAGVPAGAGGGTAVATPAAARAVVPQRRSSVPAQRPAVARRSTVVEVSEESRQVRVRGVEVDLTRTEFDLLAFLVARPGAVQDRPTLLAHVWRGDSASSHHLVDVHMANLRRKLAAQAPDVELIATVRGVGYRYDPPR